ncbi:LEA type 2 family protein [bacterium]|nr:LEA type 2 family protein [bacterium]
MKNRISGLIQVPAAVLLLLSGCAEVQQLLNVQKPALAVDRVRLTSLSLDAVGLVLDVAIQNPNAMAVNLAGFDYDFKLNALSFVKGNQNKPLEIPAKGSGKIEIPVTLGFREIYNTYQSLKDTDSTDYSIAAGLSFNLPVLGPVRVPVSAGGQLPLIKIPKVSVTSLRLNRMGLTGADLELNLSVENPNAFSFVMNALKYDFSVNGLTWMKGSRTQAVSMNKKGKAQVTIPVSLNLLQMGETVIQLLRGGSDLNYQLDGNLDLKAALPLLGSVSLPLDLSGSVPLTRK